MNNKVLEMDKKELAKELLTWRLRAGLTQPEAGEKLGVSRYSILRVENMKFVGLSTAYRVSAALARLIREEAAQFPGR